MGSTPATLRLAEDVLDARHIDALRASVRGEVRTSRHDRLLYATDASIYQVPPLAVVIPADTDDAQRAFRYCIDNDLPILPRGGGTSLAGQCVNRAVVVDLSAHCCTLEWVSDDTRACSVQPGITIDDLNDQLRAGGHGLFFAPDPATARHATIAGCIGNNAAGTRSILYGRTSESIESVAAMLATGELVSLGEASASDRLVELDRRRERTAGRAGRDTPDGGRDARSTHGADIPTIRRLTDGVVDIVRRHESLIRERFPKTIRRNAGYGLDMVLADLDRAQREGVHYYETINLAKLLCGSEGTLALTLGATLKLHPIPKAKGLAVIGFASMDEAIAAVMPLLELRPSAVELLDDLVIGLALENLEHRKTVELMPMPRAGELKAVLYVEFFSQAGPEEIAAKLAQVAAMTPSFSPVATIATYTAAIDMQRALALRKAGEPLLHAIPGARKPLGFVEDNAVPPQRLGEFVRAFRAILAREGTRGAFWAHASVGVLHVRPLLSLRCAEDRAAMERIAVEVADLARSLGGVMSGEHGDGRARGPLLERYYGPELMNAFREVKRLFDPKNLLNPGNIVSPGDIPSIHGPTRVASAEQAEHARGIDVATTKTWFDYSNVEGFDHAVELCNGAGVCRKKQGGTMCPSYMVTLDERHSTRGRGNALRLAITGQSRESAERGPCWGDAETLETLRLCLSCKACKSECPSNVDIAQYKAEYLAQTYGAASKVPLQARIFGDVRRLNKLGSRFAPVSNWVAGSAVHRWLLARVAGVDRRRTLPRFERPLSLRDANAGLPDDAPVVVLFDDCFTTYNEPSIGRATARLLNAFGYRVRLAKSGCCGRAAISTGLLGDAKHMIEQTASALAPSVEHCDALLACEPSCLSAIKDDWQALKLGDQGREDAKHISAKSSLVERFLSERWDNHPRRPEFHRPAGRILLHGHCHQKALWGIESSAALLRRVVPASQLHILDTGCCGMAGSFGFTTDRYDLSMKIGELGFLPAARSLGKDDVLVAPGTSCRHQAHDGADVRAVHPVEFVAGLIKQS